MPDIRTWSIQPKLYSVMFSKPTWCRTVLEGIQVLSCACVYSDDKRHQAPKLRIFLLLFEMLLQVVDYLFLPKYFFILKFV